MDELTTLSLEALNALREEKFASLTALFDAEDITDEQADEAEALGADLEAIDAELAGRPEEVSKEDRMAGLKEKFTVAPEDDDVDDSEDEPAEDEPVEVDEVEPEPEAVAAVKTPVKAAAKRLAAKTQRPKAPAVQSGPKPVTITAAADVPEFSTGQSLDGMEEVGQALVNRMKSFSKPSGDGRSENLIHYGVAKFKLDFPEELTVTERRNELEVLDYAANEARLSSDKGSGSLVAAGGWCTPSENLYDLCVTGETLEGILSIPEVNIARGGINFTKGPDFSAIYTNVGFLQTEAQAIAGTTKACYEVPCPDWDDVRLDAIGLCIKAPILTNAAFPEIVNRYLTGSMVAHAHKVNASVISRIVTAAGAAEAVVDFSSTAHTTLSALELLANYKRQTYAMGLNETLEVVLPFWVKSCIRDDLSLRTGQEPDAITDQQIEAHFAARHLNVQWVYDWQPLDTSNTTEGYTATFQALLYPAGAFVKGVSDVITLNAVYDAASLAVNTYTALFFEQGLLVANKCADADLVTLPVFNSGRTGIANLSVSGIAVA